MSLGTGGLTSSRFTLNVAFELVLALSLDIPMYHPMGSYLFTFCPPGPDDRLYVTVQT